jgi:hypothetical protein
MTLVCENHTLRVKITLYHTRACKNHTQRAEKALVRAEITLWRVLAKIYLKIDIHACEFHT